MYFELCIHLLSSIFNEVKYGFILEVRLLSFNNVRKAILKLNILIIIKEVINICNKKYNYFYLFRIIN